MSAEHTPLTPEREAEISATVRQARGWTSAPATWGRMLADLLAELDRVRAELRVTSEQLTEVTAACRATEEDLTGANLARWEEEQENRRLRLALRSAQRGRRKALARVAELEQQTTTARTEAIADVGDWLDEIGQKDAAHLVYTCDIPAARDMKTVPQQDDATEGGEQR